MKNRISIVKPTASLLSRAQVVEARLQELYQSARRDFIETGRLIVEAENDQLWTQLVDGEGNPYRSLDHWISTALPYGRSTAKAAADMVRKFEGIDDETLQQVPRVNLELIARLPPAKRKSPKWIQAAIELPGRALRLQVSESVPKELKVKSSYRTVFDLAPSGDRLLRRTLADAARELGDGNATKERCLAFVCTVYLASGKRKAA